MNSKPIAAHFSPWLVLPVSKICGNLRNLRIKEIHIHRFRRLTQMKTIMMKVM